MAVNRNYQRYQLQWRPSFTSGAGRRTYVVGEKTKLVGDDYSTLNEYPVSHSDMRFANLLRLAYNSTIILPFNTSVALAQEYAPGVKNKVIQYNTLGGNTVTTFGQGIQKVGLRIKIIKAGENWKDYYDGLKAIHYLSSNQGRFFGSTFLLGYDTFDSETTLTARYKVVTDSLDFSYRADTNTTVSADLQMFVSHDYSSKLGEKSQVWGSL
ncbi:MAG: hypothetical protein WC965_01905 [Thiohalomonadaceae bacterium]